MSKDALHPASAAEAGTLWPAVEAAHLFDSRACFEGFRARGDKWRVQVTERGEGVVLEPWRTHLDVLAIRALWCAPGRVASLVEQTANIAADHGYYRVLSPLLAAEAVHGYESAGMRLHETLVLLRARQTVSLEGIVLPQGTSLRPATVDDLAEIAEVDSESFGEFWRYEPERLSRCFADGRMVVAQDAEGLAGYGLGLVMRGAGTLGRLAVRPRARSRRVGEALARDTLAYLQRATTGTVSLCTQEDNLASRALYRKLGMQEMSGRLVFLIGPTRRVAEQE